MLAQTTAAVQPLLTDGIERDSSHKGMIVASVSVVDDKVRAV